MILFGPGRVRSDFDLVGHPLVDSQSPFAFAPLFLTDEEMRSLFVPLVKATFKIRTDESDLVLAEEQVAVAMAGEFWGDPETSGYKYEPEVAIEKLATDVVLIGSAHAPKPGVTEVDVGFRVGPLKKVARVFGDRVWRKTLGVARMSKPEPIDKPIPLIAERAFGGWDTSRKKVRFEARNPVGTGYRSAMGSVEDGLRLPNIEDPGQLIHSASDVPTPVLFGFTSPHWEPRSKLAGTYDKDWEENRKPLLPKDFDRRFFNAAPPGLVAPGYLTGDEEVVILNASKRPRLDFRLPGLPNPVVRVRLAWDETCELQTKLDTVIVNTDEDKVLLLWRANLTLRRGPLDVREIEVLPICSEVERPAAAASPA